MNHKRRAVCWVAAAYAVFVVYGSLLPFDWRALPLPAAFGAYLGLRGPLRAALSYTDFATNVAIFAPLALLWRACQDRALPAAAGWMRTAGVLAGCAVLSAGIEFGQLFTGDRTSSVYDLAANTGGAALGLLAWGPARRRLVPALMGALDAGDVPFAASVRARRAAWLAAPAYAALLLAANHWAAQPWLDLGAALRRVAAIRWLPFTYYQEASTVVALTGALGQALLYAPLGIGLRTLFGGGPGAPRLRAAGATFAGAGLACVAEAGRLFIAGQHPDSGNVLVAALSTAAAFAAWPAVGQRIGGGVSAGSSGSGRLPGVGVEPRAASPPAVAGAAAPARPWAARALAVALAALVAGTLLRFPVAPGLLAVAFTAYAVALLRWPSAWLWVLPAALPVLDLAPLSGWFMFDEFDLAVLVTVAVLLWRAPARRPPPLAPLTVAAWGLFALSVLVSGTIGLLPLTPLDANAFASYYSHYNALRVGKGFVWAFWLLWLTRRAGLARADLERPLTGGIVIGLAGATALALWERIVFPGLLDFSQDYRVGAFFSGMHTGGSDVEATLVLTMPFVLAAAWATQRAWVRLGCGLLFGAASYVLMVTYARGGWGAGFVALALAGALFVRSAWRQGARRRAGWVAGAVALALVLGAAVGAGRFAQQRLASSAPDLGVRLTHWRETLEMMDPGWVTDAFGMGLGRFPETYYFRNRDGDEPATFRYAADAGGSYLKLGSGRTLYVEQLVDVRPRQRYRLALDLRAAGAAASLNVLVCARTYFVGYGCQSATLATGGAAAAGAWVHRTATIDSHGLGAGPWLWRRPVKLSLENATPGTTLDVRDVALVGEDGVDLVRNGSFAGGRDHWFFSSTFNHLPWHVKNLWLGLYFDQGWLGVVAFGLLLLQAQAGLARAAWRGSPGAIAALAAVVGFVLVGLFGSLFDAPRLSLLFLLVLGGFGGRPAGAAGRVTVAVAGGTPLPAAGAPPDVRGLLRPLAAGVVALALLLAVATRLPGMHYEARALLNPAHVLAAPLLFALFVFWLAGLPALYARWLAEQRAAALLWPAALALQAVLGWALVREAVLPAMIHKVAGYPVLGWPWHWETLLRFSALEVAVAVLLTGGCLAARALQPAAPGARPGPGPQTGPRSGRAHRVWLFWAALLLPVLHLGIVVEAATDNLTELMVDGGGLRSSAALVAWGLLVGLAGSLLAQAGPGPSGRVARIGPIGRALALAVLSVPLGGAILAFGLESQVHKYGATFSALQFMLSADRQHYAVGWALALRYLMFHAAVVAAVALAQRPFRSAGSAPDLRGDP